MGHSEGAQGSHTSRWCASLVLSPKVMVTLPMMMMLKLPLRHWMVAVVVVVIVVVVVLYDKRDTTNEDS